MRLIIHAIKWIVSLFIAACAASLSIYVLALFFSAEARENAGITFSVLGSLYLLNAVLFSALFYGVIIFIFSFLPALLISGLWELSGRQSSYMLYSLAGATTALLITGYMTISFANYNFSAAWSEWLNDDWVVTARFVPGGLVGGAIMAWLRSKSARKGEKL